MFRLLIALSITIIPSIFVVAQTADDYNKVEVFAGYSRNAIDGDTNRFLTTANTLPDSGSKGFHGFEISGVYNVSRRVGIKADFSGHYESGDFNITVGTVLPQPTFAGRSKNSLYNALVGLQFKNNTKDKGFKPFAHALAGVGQARTEINGTCIPSASVSCVGIVLPQSDRERGFAGAFGGGLDLKLNNRFDLRLIQFDYNPVVVKSGTLHNFRMGVGIVIK